MWKVIVAYTWAPLVRRFGPGHKARRDAVKEYRQLQRLLVTDTSTLAYVSMRVNYAQQRLTELEGMLHSGGLNPKEFSCLQPRPAQPLPIPLDT